MTFGILGSGSWGTAIAKILTDNGNTIYWWNRSEAHIRYIQERHHNPQYLPAAHLHTASIHLTTKPAEVIANSDVIVMVIPAAYTHQALNGLGKNIFEGKKILSAIKGILPESNLLLNEYLHQEFNVPLNNYFTVLGPCHAEEVAAEKLSYLTFTGIDAQITVQIAQSFKTSYLNTIENTDIYGVQYAAVLKNIYAVGSGIAHGLDYGDNFLSVLIANCADEMAGFLKKAGINNRDNGQVPIHHELGDNQSVNYAASVYLGDLLVTCYSLHSRNRAFGNMIGKGYSVKAAQLEMSMVAEGYNASKCIHHINRNILANMPIAETIYQILWENIPAGDGFNKIEKSLV
jgi:glycerol-3-phosphate dehydrogenase (NAD(P)+)